MPRAAQQLGFLLYSNIKYGIEEMSGDVWLQRYF